MRIIAIIRINFYNLPIIVVTMTSQVPIAIDSIPTLTTHLAQMYYNLLNHLGRCDHIE